MFLKIQQPQNIGEKTISNNFFFLICTTIKLN